MYLIRTSSTLVRFIAALWVIASLSGCMAYRGGAVPQIDPSLVTVDRMERVTSYDLRVESNVGEESELRRIVERALNLALCSAGTELHPAGTIAEPDAELSIVVEATGSVVAQALSGFVAGLTWGLIPGYARVEVVAEAEISRGEGDPERYRYADSYTFWMHLFLLPFGNSPEQVLDDLFVDMMRSLALDLQRDGYLPAPTPGAPPPSDG